MSDVQGPERYPVAMTEDSNGGVTVLCNDGTVWFTRHDMGREVGTPLGPMVPCNYRWVQLPHGPRHSYRGGRGWLSCGTRNHRAFACS